MTASRPAAPALRCRRPDTQKGDYGHVLVIGGSVGLTGAPVLCALGALRSGAGLVTLGVPERVYAIVASQLPEAMPSPLPEGRGGGMTAAAIPATLALLQRANVAAVGPGLSTAPPVQRMVRALLPQVTVPVVLDADGLNAMAGHTEAFRRRRAPLVLTPHPGEMARLLGCRREAVQHDRRRVAREAARRWRAVVVLKGHQTVIAGHDGRTVVNTTGHPGMATGGMGDLLTGVIAGLIGQGRGPFDAAVTGVWLHGRAGDLAAAAIGPVGLLARDVADRLPAAIRRVITR